MTGQRASWAAAERVAQRLSDRDWRIIHDLSNARVLTGQQLTRLSFCDLSKDTQDRTRRRVLTRLHGWQVVSRLERVIGGVRAGSTGWIYSLGPIGQRLVQLEQQARDSQRIRKPWTPSPLFLQHSLAVAECYVQLVEAARSDSFCVAKFQTEPGCWWPDGLGNFIKPDAFIGLSTGQYDELIWLEVDRGTESLPTLKRKLLTYNDFLERGQLGPSGVVPQVLITAPTAARLAAIEALIEGHELFRATRLDHLTVAIKQLLAQPVPP